MVEIKEWMARLTSALEASFGPRLVFVGLQGSYGRGEAGPDSDIDVVTVLDKLAETDLQTYREIISAMPDGEKACGFICGSAELSCWPKYDLIQLVKDTSGVYGSLEGLLPRLDRGDLAQAASVGAANLYHSLCHGWLYGRAEDREDMVKAGYKAAFFILRGLHELRCGEFVHARRELALRLSGDERAVLEYGMGGGGERPVQPAFDRLLRWTQGALAESQRMSTEFT